VKKSAAAIFIILTCLIFPLKVFSMEKIPVFIKNFQIHSPDQADQYLSEGINSVLKAIISPVQDVYLSEEEKNEGFVISGSIIIIEDTSITSASLTHKGRILESYSKKSEKKSDILTNISEFGTLCKDIIESESDKNYDGDLEKKAEPEKIHSNKILFSTDEIPEEIISITCALINEDKKPDIAWITEKTLTISSIEDGMFKTLAKYGLPANLSPLSLESFSRDGKGMIIANLYDNKNKNFRAALFYLNSQSKKIEKDENLPSNYFYKSTILDSGKKIIAAKQGDNFKTSLFRKGIKILNLKNLNIENFDLKKDFDFFPSIASGSFTKPDSREWAFLKENGSLQFFSEDLKKLYETDGVFGGSVTFADYEKEGRDEIDSRYFFPTRLISVQTKDRKTMLLTIKNKDGGSRILQRLRFFKEGYVAGLEWDKISFEEVFKSRSFQGWISDFQLCDIDMDGKNELIIANPNKSEGLAKNPVSRIIVLPFSR
jgi:hypothetical protein